MLAAWTDMQPRAPATPFLLTAERASASFSTEAHGIAVSVWGGTKIVEWIGVSQISSHEYRCLSMAVAPHLSRGQ